MLKAKRVFLPDLFRDPPFYSLRTLQIVSLCNLNFRAKYEKVDKWEQNECIPQVV